MTLPKVKTILVRKYINAKLDRVLRPTPKKLSFFVSSEAKSKLDSVFYDLLVTYTGKDNTNEKKQATLDDLKYFNQAFVKEWL